MTFVYQPFNGTVKGFITSEPVPVARITGINPTIEVPTVISFGLSLKTEPSIVAS